jgi:hypothetical protein
MDLEIFELKLYGKLGKMFIYGARGIFSCVSWISWLLLNIFLRIHKYRTTNHTKITNKIFLSSDAKRGRLFRSSLFLIPTRAVCFSLLLRERGNVTIQAE